MDAELKELLAKAKAMVDAMSPEERDAMFKAQLKSFIRAELAFGSDADEREYRRRMTAGETLYNTPSGAPPEE